MVFEVGQFSGVIYIYPWLTPVAMEQMGHRGSAPLKDNCALFAPVLLPPTVLSGTTVISLRPTLVCLLTSVRAAQHPPPPTVPLLSWWAVDLSVVTSPGHRPRSAPAADTFWPMVGWEFLPVKVFGRTPLHQKDFLGVKFGCWVRVFHVGSLHTVLAHNQLKAWWWGVY